MEHDIVLETDRLFLRRWRGADLDALHGILGDRVTMAHWPKPLSIEDSAAWLQRNTGRAPALPGRLVLPGRLAVHLKETGALIGDAGLVAAQVNGRLENDLGYIIDHTFWRKGYGAEAARGLLVFGHERLGLARIVASMATDNLASAGVAKALGMTCESRFENLRNRGKTHLLFVSQKPHL